MYDKLIAVSLVVGSVSAFTTAPRLWLSRHWPTTTCGQSRSYPATTLLENDPLTGIDEEEIRTHCQQIAKYDSAWLQEYVVDILGDDDTLGSFILEQAVKTTAENFEIMSTSQHNKLIPNDEKITDNSSLRNGRNSKEENSQHKSSGNLSQAVETQTSVATALLGNMTTSAIELETPKADDDAPRVEHRHSLALNSGDGMNVTGKETMSSSPGNNWNALKQKDDAHSTRQRRPIDRPTTSQKNSNYSYAYKPPKVALDYEATANKVTEKAVSAGHENNGNEIVLFKDSSSNSLQNIPLSILLTLGYSIHDIVTLDPDALSLVVSENITLPVSGLPARWKSTNSGDVRIVSAEEAKGIMKDATANVRKSRSEDASSIGRNFKRNSKSDGALDPAMEEDAERRPRRSRQSRRIYTGRPELPPPRDDPPPPPRGFWPDIDTFRDLLREEASVRLWILGDDWSQTVKDESNWRLGLYKNWLWTLHTGLGTPLVESRTDRMRRINRDVSGRSRSSEQKLKRKRKERNAV